MALGVNLNITRRRMTMTYTQVIFSPTGGTRKVSEMLISAWTDSWNTVDLCDRKFEVEQHSFTAEDTVLVAIPSYGGRVPATAARRLSNLCGNGAKAILVCVYGNRAYEDTLVELNDIVTGNGFKIIAAVAAVAEHSIVHQYAAGRPDQDDHQVLKEYAEKIQKKLLSNACTPIHFPGNRPYKKEMGSMVVPKSGRACNQCGLCAKLCPVAAIDASNSKIVDKSKCISCMRCVSNCPQNAREVNKVILLAASAAMKKACQDRKQCELFI